VFGGQATLVTNSDSMVDLAPHWNTAEFNVFGDAGGGQANFGADTTMEAQETLSDSSLSAPTCVNEGFTGETNNLSLTSTPTIGTQGQPTIVFEQTNESPTTSTCDAASGEQAATTTTTSLSGGGSSGATISVPSGTAVTDQATLSGTNSAEATGTVTYKVYSDAGCSDLVNGGTAETITTAGTLPASAPVTLDTAGTYYWQASYSGDTYNSSSKSTCGSETETVEAPVVTTSGGSTTYTQGGGAVAVDSAVTVSDASSTTLASATVSILTNFSSGDTLNFTNQNGITGAYNAASGVLTLSGVATLAHYQTALESITFSTSASSASTRTVSFVVNDGTNSSNTATKQVVIESAATPVALLTLGGSGTSLALSNSGFVYVDGQAVVDSDSSGSISLSGKSQLIATSGLGSPGTCQASGGAHCPALTHLSLADPYASLPAPSTSGLAVYSNGQNQGCGVYTKTLVISGGSSELNPKNSANCIYYLEAGMSVSGNALVTTASNGVLLYLAGGGFSCTGTATCNLRPIAESSSPYHGFSIFEARSDSAALSVSGSASMTTSGIIYTPNAQVTVTVNGALSAGEIVCQTLSDTGNGSVTIGTSEATAGTTADSA
jgi:hypothetical protein